jgi:transcriptional regulator with XRE-family HTH domain
MDFRAQITIRAKKLGLLIRAMRLLERRDIKECADAIGVSPALFRAYEEGRRSLSLPDLELLVYYLKLPISRFWGNEIPSEAPSPTASLDLPQLRSLRQRVIGARLRQERDKANMTIAHLSQETGIPSSRLNSYELGERPIPLPFLEALLSVLNGRLETFFDQSGPVGQWMANQKAMDKFLELPPEIQAFVCQPVNRPYLDLAMKLSEMSKERLRSVAEGLLDITL